jgi:hypothetical protein
MSSLIAHTSKAVSIIAGVVVLALAGCGEGGDSATPSGVTPPPTPGTNSAPTIAAVPAATVKAGTAYSYTPTASDADGDALTFSATGLPSWATFNTSTGTLSGTPGQGDVGSTYSITISVTDGHSTTSANLAVTVVATATGSATLTWTPPTQNTDGSQLTDLAGYRVYWGTTQGNYPNSVTLSNAGLSTYVVDQLTPATWYFVVTALNSQGAESQFSNMASKLVL